MGEPETPPRWLRIFGTDVCEGDLLRIVGEHYRVAERTYPPFWAHMIVITLPSGNTISISKSSIVEDFDPDGSVTARSMEIPR